MQVKKSMIAVVLFCFTGAQALPTESIETSQIQEENNLFKKIVKIFFPCFSHEELADPLILQRDSSESKKSETNHPSKKSVASEIHEIIEQEDDDEKSNTSTEGKTDLTVSLEEALEQDNKAKELPVIPEESLIKVVEEPVETQPTCLKFTEEEQSLLDQIKNELRDLTNNSNEQSALQEIGKKYVEPLKHAITDTDYVSLKKYLDISSLDLAQFVKVSISLKASITISSSLPKELEQESIFPYSQQIKSIKENLTQTGSQLTEHVTSRVSEHRQSVGNEFQKMYAKIVKGQQK